MRVREGLPDDVGHPVASTLRRGTLVPMCLWLIFAAGLAVQVFSPHLAIEHNSFVISGDGVPAGTIVDPRALVARQRLMQAASAALVLIGALGLGIWYRGTLLRSFTRAGIS